MGLHILMGGVATQRLALLWLVGRTLAVACLAWFILRLLRRGLAR